MIRSYRHCNRTTRVSQKTITVVSN